MSTTNQQANFDRLTPPEKISFFETEAETLLLSNDGASLYQFLRKLLLNKDENSYIRKKALDQFTNAVLLNKIKVRQALSVLADDWINEELFLEVERLRVLHLLHEHDVELVSAILADAQKSEEAELSAEATYHLGLIAFQKALIEPDRSIMLALLENSKQLFSESSAIIENRIDAEIMSSIILVLEELIRQNIETAEKALGSVGQYLFTEAISRFGPEKSCLYFGFYRTLVSVFRVISSSPSGWLHFEAEVTELLYHFSLIQNEKLEQRLYATITHENLISLLTIQIIDPYFVLNFSAEKSKINSLLKKSLPESDEAKFLLHLKGVVQHDANRAKANSMTVEQSLKKIFRHRTPENIDRVLGKISDFNNISEVVRAYEDLAAPSIERFTDKLVYSCSLLQGNRKFWGNCPEDDRNTFIANMLEAADYSVKDQTRWSISNRGKSAGEIDIMIKDTFNLPYVIIEALNLDYLNTNYLTIHLDKIFKYDANGLLYNFIIVYYEGRNFGSFWKNYLTFISNHSYPYPLIRSEPIDLGKADLKITTTVHLRNEKEVLLFHVGLDLNK